MNESNKKSFKSYFNSYKDKEGWVTIEEMIVTTQAKIKLIGWSEADTIKKAHDEYIRRQGN